VPFLRGESFQAHIQLQFHKGSGWYVTDYKKGGSGWKDGGKDEKKTEAPKSETKESKAEAPKSETKTKESKAEAKTA
jgi:predicted nucleic acid-binding Zn ribbon protein